MEIQSLSELARQKILEMIASGELSPGQQIREEEISNLLDISRPPVREAFKRLEAEGLVVARPRRGVFVPEMTVKDAWEIYFLKASLYSLAVELAFENFKPKDIVKLKSLLYKMTESVALNPPNLKLYQQSHHSFHLIILDVAGNNRLTKFASNLHLQIQRFSYKSLQSHDHLKSSLDYHSRILNSILKNKKEEASRLMKDHVIESIDAVSQNVMSLSTKSDERLHKIEPKVMEQNLTKLLG